MTEQEFLDSFDAQFPYNDDSQWRGLISEGIKISPNASFCVLEEIARKPSDSAVSKDLQLAMVKVWEEENNHPLSKSVIKAAKAIITDRLLPVSDVLSKMSEISNYPHQYGALNIVYFACDDVDGLADEQYRNVVASWKQSHSL